MAKGVKSPFLHSFAAWNHLFCLVINDPAATFLGTCSWPKTLRSPKLRKIQVSATMCGTRGGGKVGTCGTRRATSSNCGWDLKEHGNLFPDLARKDENWEILLGICRHTTYTTSKKLGNCSWDQDESLPLNKEIPGICLICPIWLCLNIRYSQNHLVIVFPPKNDHQLQFVLSNYSLCLDDPRAKYQWIGFREKNRGTSYIYQKTIEKTLVFA